VDIFFRDNCSALRVKFLIDTNATVVALRERDALIGIDPAYRDCATSSSTASWSHFQLFQVCSPSHLCLGSGTKQMGGLVLESRYANDATLLASLSHLCFLLSLMCQSYQIQAIRRSPILAAGS
jgi:hypothetical protein